METEGIDYGDISVEFGEGWVSVSQRGESNPCIPIRVLEDILAEYTIRKHSRENT